MKAAAVVFTATILAITGLPAGADASTRTILERETDAGLIPADGRQGLRELLSTDSPLPGRKPAVLDLPTERPSGDSAALVLKHEREAEEAARIIETYPALEDEGL
jgi:hypothetical protein